MRIFALSDIHVDFDVNARWVENLSRDDYRQDILILAGDVSDSLVRLQRCLDTLVRCFRQVFFVPGNHDLWVIRDPDCSNSLDKFERVKAVAESCGVRLRASVVEGVAIVPLLGWYDYSFGHPEPALNDIWMDFLACQWPEGWSDLDITRHFIAMNDHGRRTDAHFTISFSHFLPRIDVMPARVPETLRKLYPVLGSTQLERLIREIRPDVHVYGHSHVNRNLVIDGVNYINNAFAYPHEELISAKTLRCIYSGRRD